MVYIGTCDCNENIKIKWPGPFPRTARKAKNCRNDVKFPKVTKYLTKLKETLINYVWEKSSQNKIFCEFCAFKIQKPGNARNQQKAL